MFTKDYYTGIPSRIVQAPTVALAMALALDRPRLSSCPRQARRRDDGQALPVEQIRNWSRQTYMHMNSYRYVCMYVHIYIYMYLFIYIYLYLFITYMCMYARTSVFTRRASLHTLAPSASYKTLPAPAEPEQRGLLS